MNFQTRHHGCFQDARKVIKNGEIGDILSIQVDASPGHAPIGGWRADPELAGLGAVNNIAVHIYDLLRFLTDSEVTEVSAMFETGREAKLEILPMVLMRFASGALAFANGNQLTPMPLNDIVIHGTAGRIDGRGITRDHKEGQMRIVTAAGERTEASTACAASRSPMRSGSPRARVWSSQSPPDGRPPPGTQALPVIGLRNRVFCQQPGRVIRGHDTDSETF
jgi:predicted dehydrogenase